MTRTAFVLVPGAGGSPWVWSRVVDLLVAAGHDVTAVDLPGEDGSAGLGEYAEIVLDTVAGRSGVTLVAGSLGGFTAPLVCERARVGGLVLVNAMVPRPGETPGAWWGSTGAIEAQAEAARAGGWGPFEEATYFLHDLDPDLVLEGRQHRRVQADGVFASTCDFTSWPDVPIRVLVGAGDRFFPAAFQCRVARERLGVEADVVPGGHLLPLAQPEAVAAYLLRPADPS